MTHEPTPHFDEALLSGYIDGELTQAQAQRVRIHLEDHPESRDLLNQLRLMRNAAISTEFRVPDDDQWDERPRGPVSFLGRYVGWGLMASWVLAVSLLALWAMAKSTSHWTAKALVFGGFAGFSLLLLSVVLDRARTFKTDRYRRVQK